MLDVLRVSRLRVLIAATLLFLGVPAHADQYSTYAPAPSFTFPGGSASTGFDALPDGRVLVTVGANLYRETASGSRVFTLLGALPAADLSGFGAAFLRVSPNGLKIAVGNNGGASYSNYKVGICTFSPLACTWYTANHYDGAWLDNRYVALTAGSLSSTTSIVTALDTNSVTPGMPVNPTLISNIGGASAGIAVDASGTLFTGNGYVYSGPSQTGYIYAFKKVNWLPKITSGPPLNFETRGIPIVDLLSAGTLAFDAEGNLLVGGGDGFGSSGDNNYFALVKASAITAALAGGGFINTTPAAGKVRKWDPDPTAATFYTVNVNRVRKELYGTGFGASTIYVYKAP